MPNAEINLETGCRTLPLPWISTCYDSCNKRRRGLPCRDSMDVRILRGTENMERPHPRQRTPVPAKAVPGTPLARYGRRCAPGVVRCLAVHEPRRIDDRGEVHIQVPFPRIVGAIPLDVKPGLGTDLQNDPNWLVCTQRSGRGGAQSGMLAE